MISQERVAGKKYIDRMVLLVTYVSVDFQVIIVHFWVKIR